MIYLDHAATTYVDEEILEKMYPYFTQKFGNPSAIYNIGKENAQAIYDARCRIGNVINAKPSEIFFTSGGSESDNWALKGIAFSHQIKNQNTRGHIITTKIEHHAISLATEWLKKEGFTISYLSVDKEGFISIDELKSEIETHEDTILVSIMYANNEVGTIEPISEIGTVISNYNKNRPDDKKIYFHTDAVQATGHVPIDVKKSNIDLLSMSSHKFYGPKGVGVLYIREGITIDSLIHGGGQEMGMRAGTENVPGIVGMSYALEKASLNMENEIKRERAIQQLFYDNLIKWGCVLNGPMIGEKRLPNNINVSFENGRSSIIQELLNNKYNIYVSAGSACNSKEITPSEVLVAMYGNDKESLIHIAKAIRITIGKKTTEEDVKVALNSIKEVIDFLNSRKSHHPEQHCKFMSGRLE